MILISLVPFCWPNSGRKNKKRIPPAKQNGWNSVFPTNLLGLSDSSPKIPQDGPLLVTNGLITTDKWFYTWVTRVITSINGVINLLITGRGPLCRCICELLWGRERAGSVESVQSLPSTARSVGSLAETWSRLKSYHTPWIVAFLRGIYNFLNLPNEYPKIRFPNLNLISPYFTCGFQGAFFVPMGTGKTWPNSTRNGRFQIKPNKDAVPFCSPFFDVYFHNLDRQKMPNQGGSSWIFFWDFR